MRKHGNWRRTGYTAYRNCPWRACLTLTPAYIGRTIVSAALRTTKSLRAITVKKKRSRPSSSSKPPQKKRALKKAVPPPDDPLLRYQAESFARGEGTEDIANARVRAMKQSKRMPVADEDSDPSEP